MYWSREDGAQYAPYGACVGLHADGGTWLVTCGGLRDMPCGFRSVGEEGLEPALAGGFGTREDLLEGPHIVVEFFTRRC